MLSPFRVYRPSSLQDACEFLSERGLDAAAYAGGTELLLAMKEDLVAPAYLVDVKRLGLGDIALDQATGELRIGATATHREIESWARSRPHWSALAEMERNVANVRVRNQGTIGGNLCFGEPHADPGTLLSAWDASVEITDAHGSRRLPIHDLLLDEFSTALEDGDLLTEIGIPSPPARSGTTYLRFGFLERPSLGVATRVDLEPAGGQVSQARIAIGAVGPRPERIELAERTLAGVATRGADWERATREAASAAAETCVVSADAHGSEAYKRHLVEVHVRRALDASVRRAGMDAALNGAA